MANQKLMRLNVNINPDDYRRLKEISKDMGVSISALIRLFVKTLSRDKEVGLTLLDEKK